MGVCVGMDVEGVHPERLAASTDEVGKRLGHCEASLAGSLCDTLVEMNFLKSVFWRFSHILLFRYPIPVMQKQHH